MARTEPSDAVLVLAARDGDKEAFARVFERHRPWLVALCRRTLGDAGLAEDAAQDAALQALLHLDRLRQPERFGPWLWAIGLHLCQRWRRQRAQLAHVCDTLDVSWEPEEPDADPEALAEVAELGGRVRQAVEELPAGQRDAVVLFYLDGLSEAEAAGRLGLEVGAVKARLHKARAALRSRLGETAE